MENKDEGTRNMTIKFVIVRKVATATQRRLKNGEYQSKSKKRSNDTSKLNIGKITKRK